MWKTVLFDLDGTLTDSAEGITKSVQYALEKLGKEVPELENLQCFVGPPLKEMFMEYAGLMDEEGTQAVAYYRERYIPTGMFENHLYPRIIKMLDLFEKEGITMAVASSKPEPLVKQILEHFGIDDYFKEIVGSEMNGSRVHKKDVIEEAVKRLKMENRKDEIVLVGDTKYDVEGAKEAGIQCIAVTYGYGVQEDIEAAQPVYIAESVSDVAECVLSQHKKVKPETTGYKFWRILYPILFHVGVTELVGSVAMAAIFVMQFVENGVIDVMAGAEKLISINSFLVLGYTAVLIPVTIWFFKKDEWKRKDQGIRNRIMKPGKFGAGQIVLVGLFFIIYSVLLNQLIEWSGMHELFPGYSELAEGLYNAEIQVVSYLAVAILAPIAEELVYRGLVYRRIRDYLGVKSATFISAAIFGLVHGNVIQFLFAFLIGLALAAVYERYKTIWAPIAGHIFVNLFSCVMTFAAVEVVPANDITAVLIFAVEGMIVVILGVLTLKKWKPKNKVNQNKEEAAN